MRGVLAVAGLVVLTAGAFEGYSYVAGEHDQEEWRSIAERVERTEVQKARVDAEVLALVTGAKPTWSNPISPTRWR